MGLRIGYDGKFLWAGRRLGSRSGHGVQTRELLRSLAGLGEDDEYLVYLIHPEAELPTSPRVRPCLLPAAARSSVVRNLVAVPLALRRDPVDVLLSYSVLPAFSSCPNVLILDDLFSVAHPEWLPRRYAIPHARATRASVARADRVVTATEFMKREVVRRLRADPDKIDVVPFGISHRFFERAPTETIEAVRRKHGITKPYVLSVNDIHPRKNLDGLVDAFGLLKAETGIDHSLVLVGRTLWRYPAFREKVERSKWRDDIVLAGYVETADLGPLYQGASLFVYPSFYEGWGLQVHEAMCAGVPVAVSKDSAMAEISAGAALEFDPHDPVDMARCMHLALSDAELCRERVAQGLRHVRRFSWEATARDTREACRRAVARRAKGTNRASPA